MRRLGLVVPMLLLAPAPAWAKCEIAQILELKVTMNGSRPMVAAGINGVKEHFLADSGAFFSDISPGTAAELKLPLTPLPPSFELRGIGGSQSASTTRVKTLTLEGVDVHNVTFIVGGSEVGPGTAGLLGQNVLGLGDVEYDLAHGAIRLMRPHDCGRDANLAYWAGTAPVSMIDLERRDERNPHTVGTILINGTKIHATFDTGAGTSALSLQAAARLGIKPDSPGVVPAGFSRGLGKRIVRSWIAPVDDVKIGGEEIRRTKLRISDIDLDTDMLVGADFFISHRVYVANGSRRMFFTYDGGPIFNITPNRVMDAEGKAAALPAEEAAPTDAEGFGRRGAGYAAQREWTKAIADFDRATELAPTESRFFYQRAMAHLGARQPLLAMDDLDRTIKLAPNDAQARLVRAEGRLARHDAAAAREDVDAIDKLLDAPADMRLRLGGLYDQLDAPEQAIAQYDQWIKYHPDDSRRASALNGRCWGRAQLGRDLDRAMSDCNTAIRLRPNNADYLDSRALVRLRQGDNAGAVKDYDAALAIAPKLAWSLYGRGIAEHRLGDKARGDADVAAAIALQPGVTERAKRLGLIS